MEIKNFALTFLLAFVIDTAKAAPMSGWEGMN